MSQTIKGAVLTDVSAGHLTLLSAGTFYRGEVRFDLSDDVLALLPLHQFQIVEGPTGDENEAPASSESPSLPSPPVTDPILTPEQSPEADGLMLQEKIRLEAEAQTFRLEAEEAANALGAIAPPVNAGAHLPTSAPWAPA